MIQNDSDSFLVTFPRHLVHDLLLAKLHVVGFDFNNLKLKVQ